ncbi:MAG: polyphosphate kinase 2 [Bacteroidetes bacterium]|nr:polyphosphate kinase 2 [Bacteroidota bacterium]
MVEKKNYKRIVKDNIVKQLAKYGGITEQEILERMDYYVELQKLQIELNKMQQWVVDEKKRIAIIFEGRDAAGKGGSIRRFTQHTMPRHARVVALPAPTEIEKGQWYFTRYIKELPNPGSIVFFDRSWYNRAVVEPVMGFCTKDQYEQFLRQVPDFEHMLYEDGITLIKFWFSVSREEQEKRFSSRAKNPLKNWKLSPVDKKAQKLWDEFSYYKEQMLTRTHTNYAPWIIVRGNEKLKARLESIRYVLNVIPYKGKDKAGISLNPDPNIIGRYYMNNAAID